LSEDQQGTESPSMGSSPDLPARLVDSLPSMLPILVSSMGPIFPGMMSPVLLPGEREQRTLEQATTPFVGVVAPRPEAAIPPINVDVKLLYDVGVAGRQIKQMRSPDGVPGVVVMSSRRMRIREFIRSDTMLLARVEYPEDVVRDQREVDALLHRARQSLRQLLSLDPEAPEQIRGVVDELTDPGAFADFVAFHLGKDVPTRQAVLASFELDSRLRSAMLLIERELDLAQLGARLRDEIRLKIEARQKEHYLREQLQAIRRELGEEVDQRELDRQSYAQKIEAAGMPQHARDRANKELDRLVLLPTEAAEHHLIRTYLDWLVELPWSSLSGERQDIGRARRILDEDHHGLTEVKQRIVEFLAVRKLNPTQQAAILCLVGPPGVGKTSLGRSVARAMSREFHRVSLGGMRDEAEIKGHRRTYVGAMPGKIIQGLRRVGTRNPVFMLDELDKLGADWRGDPASALLEVLDPAQNAGFDDMYLDLPFDLSQVMFLATANVSSQIPQPLLDRMELIHLSGYIPQEKQAIGRRYLLPRQITAHGLKRGQLKLLAPALQAIVDGYTREAGVRELERMIGRVCRKVAVRVVERPGSRALKQVVVTPDNLETFLGPRRFRTELVERCRRPGVVVGLAWTPVGGEILFIEASSMAGRGVLKLTGKLGSVMNESAQLAYSLVRSRATRFGIDEQLFRERDIHLHVPAGAVPKDGPSAGVALTMALVSLLWHGRGRAVKARVAMTGEITLRGNVLAVGGIKDKVIGAHRAGVKTVVLPADNEPDVAEIPAQVRRGLRFIHVRDIEQVVAAVFPGHG